MKRRVTITFDIDNPGTKEAVQISQQVLRHVADNVLVHWDRLPNRLESLRGSFGYIQSDEYGVIEFGVFDGAGEKETARTDETA